jgi:hypothetical protein
MDDSVSNIYIYIFTEMMVGGRQRTSKEIKELYLLHFYR